MAPPLFIEWFRNSRYKENTRFQVTADPIPAATSGSPTRPPGQGRLFPQNYVVLRIYRPSASYVDWSVLRWCPSATGPHASIRRRKRAAQANAAGSRLQKTSSRQPRGVCGPRSAAAFLVYGLAANRAVSSPGSPDRCRRAGPGLFGRPDPVRDPVPDHRPDRIPGRVPRRVRRTGHTPGRARSRYRCAGRVPVPVACRPPVRLHDHRVGRVPGPVRCRVRREAGSGRASGRADRSDRPSASVLRTASVRRWRRYGAFRSR